MFCISNSINQHIKVLIFCMAKIWISERVQNIWIFLSSSTFGSDDEILSQKVSASSFITFFAAFSPVRKFHTFYIILHGIALYFSWTIVWITEVVGGSHRVFTSFVNPSTVGALLRQPRTSLHWSSYSAWREVSLASNLLSLTVVSLDVCLLNTYTCTSFHLLLRHLQCSLHNSKSLLCRVY